MICFSSAAAADIYMLDEHAQHLLKIIGKAQTPRGIIEPGEIEAALAALRQAIEQEPAPPEQDDADDDEAQGQSLTTVRLSQRAFPLMEMLQRAQRRAKPVLWGV